MATELKKDLVRVSTDKVDDKEITIILTTSQEIELKLKGQRGEGEKILIKDLYSQLYNLDSSDNKSDSGPISISNDSNIPRRRGDRKMISLYDLRSHNAISVLEVNDMAKFDQIIKSVIDSIP